MLTIAKLGNGQESYYLTKVARGLEDYYSGDGECAGTWMGRGAARLKLDGEAIGEQLRPVLAGLHPGTGERLSGRPGMKRVPGWDLTFSAPKSVSVLYGLGGPAVAEQVVAAHEAAVAAGVAYLDANATVSRRRVGGRIEQVRGEGLVIAAFRHRTSRAGDPQLHTHALAANLVERVDGGWGALHSTVIYRHARTGGFVYQAVLRGELTARLGVSWGRVHNGYAEIDGIPTRVLQLFSKRRAEIERALDAAGEDSARAAQVAAHRTRTAKEYGVDPSTLYQRWEAELRALGVDPAELLAVTGRPQPTVGPTDLESVIEDMTAAHGLTAQTASFDRRDVVRAWCEALPVGSPLSLSALDDVVDLALADRRVVPVVDRHPGLAIETVARTADGEAASAVVGERRWSTTDMLAVEQRLLERAQRGTHADVGRVESEVVEAHLAERADLSAEQAAVVHRLTTSGAGVEVLVGRAGTGKTYTLAAAAQVWRAAGYRPIGVAMAARAAAELETVAGIASTTVAQFLIDADQAPSGLLGPRHVLVVDEAAMLDTRRLDRVLRHAERAGAKVVLVGDHHQLPAVEAGGAFAALVARVTASELAENRRQVECWERDTLARLRTGADGRAGIAQVVASYGDHGRLHVGTTPGEVRAAMVADWYEGRRAGRQVAMVALRRADVDELNTRARVLLVADGTVAANGMTVGRRVFARGDRVVCLRNDRRLGVHNALFAEVTDVDADGASLTMKTEGDERIRVLPRAYLEAGHLAHGYASTIHKAQGSTYDRTLVLGDDRLYRQAGYTGLSRGKERNDLYLVVDDDRDRDGELDPHGQAPPDEPVDRLVTALGRDGGKILATDEADAQHARIQPVQSLATLWAEHDEVAARLAPRPADHTGALQVLAEAIEAAHTRASAASVALGAAEERVAAAHGFRRRLEGRLARRDLARAVLDEHRLGTERDRLVLHQNVLEADQVARRQWLDAQRADLARMGRLERTLEHRSRLAGCAAEIERPSHVVAVLGDPPADVAGRLRWRTAAGALESYRARWGIGAVDDFTPPVCTPHAQLAHAVDVEEAVTLALDTGVGSPARVATMSLD